jgi:hypothetical protein
MANPGSNQLGIYQRTLQPKHFEAIHALWPAHVSDMAYNLLLSILLSHNVPEASVDQMESGQYRIRDTRAYRESEVSHIAGATWVGYDDFDLARLAGIATHVAVAVYWGTAVHVLPNNCSGKNTPIQGIASMTPIHVQSNSVANVHGGIFQ